MTARRCLVVTALAATTLLAPVPAASASELRLGFFEYGPLTDGPQAPAWMARADAAGATVVRLSLAWLTVAPVERPAGFRDEDPGSTGYRWSALDARIEALANAGMAPLITVRTAPAWAEGPSRPRSARPGTWKPDADLLGAFMQALATRYSGSYPDSAGGTLPRVRHWQVWNEPNLSVYLAPQWERNRGGLRPVAVSRYRSMLNAGYAGVKRAQPDATVLAAGTAPYGDRHPGGERIPPATFLRRLLCLRDTTLRPMACPAPTHFDAYDHHTYGVARPNRRALNPDDVATPDLSKLTRVVTRAVKVGTAVPRGRKPLWITEVSYDSGPPDPNGVPLKRHARWLEQSFFLLWRQGVRTILWFSIVDKPPDPNYDVTYQAGVYFADGRQKPALTAFRFPFVRRGDSAWGRAPADGSVVIERHSRGAWRPVTVIAGRRHETFEAKVPRSAPLRARQGAVVSLAWPGD